MKKTMRRFLLTVLAVLLLAVTATGAAAFPAANQLDQAKELYEQQFGTPFPDVTVAAEPEMDNMVSGMLSRIFSIWTLMILILVLAISMEIATFAYARRTLATRQLPSRCTGSRTIQPGSKTLDNCPKCGTAFGEAAFCPKCGTSNLVKGTYRFPIQGKLSGEEFEEMVNGWLAENPYIEDLKLHVSHDHRLLYLTPQQKFYVTEASLEYSVTDQPVRDRYGVAFLFKKKYIGMNAEKLLDMWQENNGDCRILSHSGGHIHRWSNQGGNSHEYYSYILYRKDVR